MVASAAAVPSALREIPAAIALESELSTRSIEVPLLPNVAAEVLSSTLDDKANATRLAELIQQDQALATHVLRIVNSPAFRGSAEIVALQQAIARLGMERIREIALTISLKGTLFKSGPYDSFLKDSWDHGLRSGLWAKEIARVAKKNVEIAYLCGLLHNVGAPLVINRVSELDAGVESATLEALVQHFGPQAGLILVEEWKLPSAVALAIRFKDRFEEAENARDTVAIVDAAAHVARLHAAEELTPETGLAHAALQHLNFYPQDAETLCSVAERVAEIVSGMN